MSSCNERQSKSITITEALFPHTFSPCVYCILRCSNQRNYFENAKTCSKRTLKTRVETKLNWSLIGVFVLIPSLTTVLFLIQFSRLNSVASPIVVVFFVDVVVVYWPDMLYNGGCNKSPRRRTMNLTKVQRGINVLPPVSNSSCSNTSDSNLGLARQKNLQTTPTSFKGQIGRGGWRVLRENKQNFKDTFIIQVLIHGKETSN